MSYTSHEFCQILRDFIRRLILDDTIPEDVTRAISYYMYRAKEKTIPSLSVTIFLSVLLNDAITNMEFCYHEYGKSPFNVGATVTDELIA